MQVEHIVDNMVSYKSIIDVIYQLNYQYYITILTDMQEFFLCFTIFLVNAMEYLDWAEISKRIKALRNKNGISRERLSEIIGVSSSFINLVERGDSGISVDNLYRLSRVFGVSVDYLLTGEQEGNVKSAPIKMNRLNAVLGDCTDSEFEFAIGLITYLKNRVEVKK